MYKHHNAKNRFHYIFFWCVIRTEYLVFCKEETFICGFSLNSNFSLLQFVLDLCTAGQIKVGLDTLADVALK
jgi:hypothetical protein